MLSLLYGPNLISVPDCWKIVALTIQNSVGKVMSLLFNMLPRLVITFLPRSKRLLISWLQSAFRDVGTLHKIVCQPRGVS